MEQVGFITRPLGSIPSNALAEMEKGCLARPITLKSAVRLSNRYQLTMKSTILFSGPGGSSQGLKAAGFDTEGIELCKDAVMTATEAGHKTVQADVTQLDPRDFPCELLQASPPCQTFSVAGLKAGRHLEDYRQELVYEPMRWAKAIRPQFIILEQVPYVVDIWNEMAVELQTLGYHTHVEVLNAVEFEVPQSRKRAILLASKDEFSPPEKSPGKSMAETCGWDDTDLVGFPRRADARGKAVEIDGMLYRARDLKSASLPANTLTSKARSWSRFSGTERHRVTIEEAGLLQSFPLDYPWQGNRTSQFLQCANAFSPRMVENIAANLTDSAKVC